MDCHTTDAYVALGHWCYRLLATKQSLEKSRLEGTATPAPRIFALVVAVDEYRNPQLENLSGCKNDGIHFIQYLMGVLGVPPSQICFLVDEQATEMAIIREFNRFLIDNADIKRDDALVFFFSGHGSQLDAPEGWITENGKIELLCPHDVQTIGDNGKTLWGISDRTISALMRNLAIQKSDNIVAVFDCCFSGGLARDSEKTLRVRSLPPPSQLPPADLHEEIWSSISETSSRGVGRPHKANASLVLLAACRPDEVAIEDSSAKGEAAGLFTTALVECLRSNSLHNTSYAKLFEKLDLKNQDQHPQCEGTNKDRLLFSVNVLRDGEATFKVSRKGRALFISAGNIHGVCESTEFTVKSTTEMYILKAKRVGVFETELENRCDGIGHATAFVSHWGHPRLKVHSSIPHTSAHITVVPTNERADVALCQNDTKWELERFDALISMYSDPVIHFEADEGRVTDILDAISNFNSFLYRSGGIATSFAGKVKTSLNRIEWVKMELGPVGDDLLQVSRSSHLGVDVKEATITDLDSQYCLTLENYSETDLFPYIFYLDPSDYGIQEWYVPPSSTMRAPLRGQKDGSPSFFAIGYGAFGTEPIEFYLPSGRDIDSGFLKVFLTTKYVDMSYIAQDPIQEVSSSRGARRGWGAFDAWTCETFVLTCKKS